MAVERWCEIRDDLIVNTLLVDPETEDGQSYLQLRQEEGALLLPEEEAQAQYQYAPPPFQP